MRGTGEVEMEVEDDKDGTVEVDDNTSGTVKVEVEDDISGNVEL